MVIESRVSLFQVFFFVIGCVKSWPVKVERHIIDHLMHRSPAFFALSEGFIRNLLQNLESFLALFALIVIKRHKNLPPDWAL